MKSWSAAPPRVPKNIKNLVAIGLLTLTAVADHQARAEDASTQSPAKTQDSAAQSAKAKAKAAAALGPAECVRTGQRVIAALARDDSGAATQFHTFYIAFKCSPQHLAQAFGCLVNLQTANPGLSNPTPEQVTQCWDDPSVIPKVQPPHPADTGSEKK